MTQDGERPKPLGRIEVARAISEAVTAALDVNVSGHALVSRLRRLADRIETHLNGGVPIEPKKKKAKKVKPPIPKDQIGGIFEFWQTTLEHPEAIFTAGRRKVIADRLSEGYSVETLKQAIVGCSRNPHNMGHNERKERYDDLTLILRNGENVERFAKRADGTPIASTTKADTYDPRQHGDLGHLGGEYRAKWNLYVDVGPDRYESEWAKRRGA